MEQYHRDRHVLLNFILSSSLIQKVVMPPGAVSLDDVDLDQISVDYVIDCARKGNALELSEAIRHYYDSLSHPQKSTPGFLEEISLSTDAEASGSPPARPPPHSLTKANSVSSSLPASHSTLSAQFRGLSLQESDVFDDEEGEEEVQSLRTSRHLSDGDKNLVQVFPPFATGVSDDDLRETAYEVLLASVGSAGGLPAPTTEKKKGRKTKLLGKLGRSKIENALSSHPCSFACPDLLETMRIQLEISEAMDVRTRKALLHALADKEQSKNFDLLVPLELLSYILPGAFSDKRAYLRWQKRQLNMLEESLVNFPAMRLGDWRPKANELKVLLRKFEESAPIPAAAGDIRRAECLRSIRDVTAALITRPGVGNQTGELCNWAVGYPLNVRLYERLLLSVFDMLDESKLSEEAEEILKLLKSTWRMLGITESVHHVCYSWVLFRQFVITGDEQILQHTSEQLRKLTLKSLLTPDERSNLYNLNCSVDHDGCSQDFTFIKSFLLPIQRWADSKLSDYYLQFNEPTLFEGLVEISLLCKRVMIEEPDQAIQDAAMSDHEQIELYISSSARRAFERILKEPDAVANLRTIHPLVFLAEECENLLKKDSAVFMPVLSKWLPHAQGASAFLLHDLFGAKLKPFLDRADYLKEDIISVISAAESLEQIILTVVSSSESEDLLYKENLTPYQVGDISATLVMRWINSQMKKMLEWVERAVQQEQWEPISLQQRHGSSIVEVYRIAEETVDQFFALKVRMRVKELNALLCGLDNAFQIYTRHAVDGLCSENELVPPTPVLTRRKKESGIKAFVRKEATGGKIPEHSYAGIRVPSTSNLCVRLNTLYYAVNQLNNLQESIRGRWAMARVYKNNNIDRKDNGCNGSNFSQKQNDGFEACRNLISVTIANMCRFIGIKIVFCDLKEQFIDNLYKPSVSLSRFDMIVDALDTELNELCDVILLPLRDQAVTALLQASLDGLERILLDGGPSRVFFPNDAELLEEDLEILKEFFVSGGQGLPRGTVESMVANIRPIVMLHSYESHVLINDLKLNAVEGRTQFGDPQVVLRILCHRSDLEANYFLKKQYKIPRSAV